MEPPPAALFQRNPTAFHLYVDLYETPRAEITLDNAARITGATETAARRAVAELIDLGVLSKIGRGRFRPANAPALGPPAEKQCIWCRGPLPPSRRKYCSDPCRSSAQSKARNARLDRDRPELHCVVCGKHIPRRPRAGHQRYCSRHCEYVDRRDKQQTTTAGDRPGSRAPTSDGSALAPPSS